MKKSDLFVIEFGATWCGPCQQMQLSWKDKDVLEQLQEYANGSYFNKKNEPVRVFNLDVDKDKTYAKTFSISSVPTTIVVDRNGNVYKRLIGYLSGPYLANWLKKPCLNEDCSPIHKVNDTFFLQ